MTRHLHNLQDTIISLTSVLFANESSSPSARSCWPAVLLLTLIALGTPALAEQPLEVSQPPARSSIQGVVTVADPNGGSTTLEGVTPKLTGAASGQDGLNAVSDAQGHYQFENLKAGLYQLEVQLEGFQPFTKAVVLGPGEMHVENITLTIEVVVQKVDVHEQVAQVSTQSVAPTTQISSRQLDALPLAEQKFKTALPLVPGVVRTRDGKLNFKGESENQGMLLIGSMQAVDPVTGSFSIPIPLDAVQEMHVDKAPYDSQYGGFSGGLTAIDLKPPTGNWHYGLMDFVPSLRGKAGHIVGIADDTPRAYFGGPILKDKLNFSESATYDLNNRPVRGLPWPHNETETQGFATLTNFQAILSPRHLLMVDVAGFSNRVRYSDINSLVPQPASANDGQHGFSVGANDSYQFTSGGVLNSTFLFTRFDSNAYGQGPKDMLITPDGWGGNYFNTWNRNANHFELLSYYQLPQKEWLGRHQLKVGEDITHVSYTGHTYSHPIQLLRQDGSLAEKIEFEGPGPLDAHETEAAEFVQDHWSITDRLAFDLGGRLLSQSSGRSAAFTPRAGLVFAPSQDRKTIVRAGAGFFYDRVAMLGADFAQNPTRVVTLYGENGVPLGSPVSFQTACAKYTASGPVREMCPPNASARNFTTTLEVDREIFRTLTARATYLFSRTQDIDVVNPLAGPVGGTSLLALSSTGATHYHEIESTLRYRPAERSELNVSYIHSRGRGDLNTVSSIFAPFEQPVIRPNYTGNFASDMPNRAVSWGIFSLPKQFTLSPVVDVRSGLPYSDFDPYQNYVGVPNSHRLPTYFSVDARIYRDFKFSSLPLMRRFKNQKLRLGMYSINITNHSNALDVYSNVTSPYFGHFVGFQHRICGFVVDAVN